MLKLEADSKDLEKQIKELRAELSDPDQELLSIEQFLNLAKNAGSKVKAADEVCKDHICRIIFLNLVVDEEKVANYQMTKAFSKLEKAQNVLNGRDVRPSLELFDYIVKHHEQMEAACKELDLIRSTVTHHVLNVKL